MEYTIELCVNYNDYGVDFTDYDVEEIIGEYDTSNKEEVIEKFNNLVHTIENKDSILLNKLNDSPWHKVCDKAKYPWENIFEPEEAKQLHSLGIL